jgi:cyclase
MKNFRIIPRLDIKGPNLVKGIHLEGLRVLGRPSDFSKYYYEQGADELLYMDVVASLYERNSLRNIIEETANNVFIPLTVGGGLRTVSDIKNVLRAGADKVCLNTAAIRNPTLIEEAALRFGSSTIVVAIEAIRQPSGVYMAFIDNGREYTGIEVVEWAKRIVELGAGEIVITSVDREGTGKGFDIELIRSVAAEVSIPIIAHGGAGSKYDIEQILKTEETDAVCISSIFHYDLIRRMDTFDENVSEGNFDFLRNKEAVKRFDAIGIHELKEYLLEKNIRIRK